MSMRRFVSPILLVLLYSALIALASPVQKSEKLEKKYEERKGREAAKEWALQQQLQEQERASAKGVSLMDLDTTLGDKSSWKSKGRRSRRVAQEERGEDQDDPVSEEKYGMSREVDRGKKTMASPEDSTNSDDGALDWSDRGEKEEEDGEEIDTKDDNDDVDCEEREDEMDQCSQSKRTYPARRKMQEERKRKFDKLWEDLSLYDLNAPDLAFAVKKLEIKGKSRHSIAQMARAKVEKEYTKEFRESYTEFANRLTDAMKLVRKNIRYRGDPLPSRGEIIRLAREHIDRRIQYREETRHNQQLAARRQAYKEKIKPAQVNAIAAFRRHLQQNRGIADMDTLSMRDLELVSRRYPEDDLNARRGFTKHLWRHIEERKPDGPALLQEFKIQRGRYNKKLPKDPLEKLGYVV